MGGVSISGLAAGRTQAILRPWFGRLRASLAAYSDDEARDDHGKWTTGAGSSILTHGWVTKQGKFIPLKSGSLHLGTAVKNRLGKSYTEAYKNGHVRVSLGDTNDWALESGANTAASRERLQAIVERLPDDLSVLTIDHSIGIDGTPGVSAGFDGPTAKIEALDWLEKGARRTVFNGSRDPFIKIVSEAVHIAVRAAADVIARIEALPAAPPPSGKWATLHREKTRHYGVGQWKRTPLRLLHKPVDAEAFKDLPVKLRDRLVCNAPVRSFDPHSLATNQPVVHAGDLIHFVHHSKDPEPVIILKTQMGLYVHNGNHRSALAMLAGKKVKGRFVDLSLVQQIAAQLAADKAMTDSLNELNKETDDERSEEDVEAYEMRDNNGVFLDEEDLDLEDVVAYSDAEPWIGFDLDSTLAKYDKWRGPEHIGKPVPKIVAILKQHLADGDTVKIFTARVADDPDGVARKAIEKWCLKYIGQKLPITNEKDHGMVKLYDDRAVAVEPNTGNLLSDPDAIKAMIERAVLLAADEKCPFCGSEDFGLMPTDFETAKCAKCGRTWEHAAPDDETDEDLKAYSDDEARDDHGRWTAGDTNTDRTTWHFDDYHPEEKINGVSLTHVANPDFDKLTNPDLKEGPLKVAAWQHAAAGVVMLEPDNKVWVVTPDKYFGSYRNTFPKGTQEYNESLQQAAVRETYEETGLLAKITGVLGDVNRSTSATRYYIGERVGGSPAMAGPETYAVKLMDLNDAKTDERLTDVTGHETADKDVLGMVRDHLGIDKPVPAPPEPGAALTHADIMHEKVGGAQGTNAGGVYRGTDGVDRYVKLYNNPEQVHQEALANNIYRDLGVNAPNSHVFDLPNGKEAFASDIIQGGKTLEDTGLTKDNAREVLKGFAADVLTANWDSVGLTYDNILMKDGEAHRIDNGASFLYRAQGSSKPAALLNQATEIKGFFNPAVNREYSILTKKAGYSSAAEIPGLRSQVQKIVSLRDSSGGWDKYLSDNAPYLSSSETSKISGMLTSRTAALADYVGIHASADELLGEMLEHDADMVAFRSTLLASKLERSVA